MSNLRQQSIGSPYTGIPVTVVTAINSYTFVNTTDKIEWIFQVPDPADGTRTVTITKLGYRLTSVTGTSPLMNISLQGVDGSGLPDGTIKSAAGAAATFTPAGSATWNWVTLGSSYTANAGEFLAIVIGYTSGTLNGSNTPVIGVTVNSATTGLPYEIQNIAGVRTRSSAAPLYGFSSAGKAFGYPIQTINLTTFNTTNERALRWVFDPQVVQSYKVVAASFQLVEPAAAKSTVINLYQGTTVLQTVTWDSDVAQSNGNGRVITLWFDTTNPLATLYGGQEYRIGVGPTGASDNIAFYDLGFAAAADMEALTGGQQWYLSTRASGGATAWTDVTTTRPIASLIVADWTTPPPGIVVAT